MKSSSSVYLRTEPEDDGGEEEKAEEARDESEEGGCFMFFHSFFFSPCDDLAKRFLGFLSGAAMDLKQASDGVISSDLFCLRDSSLLFSFSVLLGFRRYFLESQQI